MAAPLVAAAAKGLAKKAASSAAKGAAKKAASSDSGKKAMKLGCLAIMAMVAVPVFIFLALVSPIIGAFQSHQNMGCQGQTAPPQNDVGIALGAIESAGVTDDNKATVMVAIAGAETNFDRNAAGGLWGVKQSAYPAGYPPQVTPDASVTPPDSPNWINDPGNAATAAVAVAGGSGVSSLAYWSNNAAYQAFASAGGVTTKNGVTTYNWSVASTTNDSGGFFSQAQGALAQMKADPNGNSCTCATGTTTGGGPGGTLSAQQTAYAQQIIGIAKTLNLPQSAWVIGLMVALDESGIKQYANSNVPSSLNYPHQAVGSDHGSVGIFQQQVNPDGSNFGWGTLDQLMNPTSGTAYQAFRFFNALGGVSGWQSMQPWVAAQAVQRSGTPDGSNYEAFLNQATSIVNANSSAPPVPLPAGVTPGNPNGGGGGAGCTGTGNGSTQAIAAAANQLDAMNLPYCWAGGHTQPAQINLGAGAATCYRGAGLDCSGAVAWVLQHAGVNFPTGVSGGYMTWGDPATASTPGVLIYASNGHTFLSINGRVFSSDTVTSPTGGPHWRTWPASAEESPADAPWVIRHVPGTA